jgi:hydrogenase/urease accessory protein HupE
MVALLLLASLSAAHELKPAYLEIATTSTLSYDVTWKTPIIRGRVLAVEPGFPRDCLSKDRSVRSDLGTALVSNWRLSCDTPLAGRRIEFQGLDATFTDVLVRLQPIEGTVQTLRATPDQPSVLAAVEATPWNVAANYFVLGVEHILSGLDHLLFVVALVLLITGFRRLVETITAFTVAHSITLAATSLGWLQVSQTPVEAVIALSIVFMANELACMRSGKECLTTRWPWVVAFVFGLMHGFGFAGALADIGLPEREIPLALLSFNLGVEAGQLVFVVGVVALLAVLANLVSRQRLALVASYPIGIVASVWLFERVIT